MKNGTTWREKISHGKAGIGFAAFVIVAVILVNIGVSFLCTGAFWYIDLSPESRYNAYTDTSSTSVATTMYRLMDETVNYLKETFDDVNAGRDKDDPVKVRIIFCEDPDLLIRTAEMRYIYYTALSLQKEFPDTVSVETRDVWDNPSSVDEFRTTSHSAIYQTSIIIASGTEFRVSNNRLFYTFENTTDATPWAYSGEKQFVKQIRAVTRAESPVCCLTVNHGEPFAGLDLSKRSEWSDYGEFVSVIEGAGYKVQFLDLEKDEIPADCRLIVTFDPQTDFRSAFGAGAGAVSETAKLDKFLDKSYSFLVFADADTPRLPNLEEYLELWGICFSRYESEEKAGNWRVSDPGNALNSGGTTFVAEYPIGGLGKNVLTEVTSGGAQPKAVFVDAMPITYPVAYKNTYVMADSKTGTAAYNYGHYTGNNRSRSVFDVFRAGSADTPAQAYAVKNGEVLTDAGGTPIGGSDVYNVMTLTVESRTTSEGYDGLTVNNASFVGAIGSTEFASDRFLSSATSYGNTDVLLAVLRSIGQEVVPVGIKPKALYTGNIGYTVKNEAGESVPFDAVVPTVVMAVLPAFLLTLACAVVLIPRRVRR